VWQTEMAAKPQQQKKSTPVLQNKKAYFDYFIDKTYEAGIVLLGTEVKSLRQGNANFTDAFAFLKNGEVFLKDFYIKEFEFGTYTNHEPRRIRKLLLHKDEIDKIDRAVSQKAMTLLPLKVYFKKGLAKVLLGVARGKKQYDKRATMAEKDAKREVSRRMKDAIRQ
jgi:SsrA-binding protein